MRLFAYAMILGTLLVCFAVIFLIAANQGPEWEKSWTANFILYVFMDIVVTPILILLWKITFSTYKDNFITLVQKAEDFRIRELIV